MAKPKKKTGLLLETVLLHEACIEILSVEGLSVRLVYVSQKKKKEMKHNQNIQFFLTKLLASTVLV
jgi:hypothetical protein